MPKIYWMFGYNIREGRVRDYQAFLKSKAFKKVWADIEKETGMKYLQTYGTIIPSPGGNEIGDFDAYDFWELPNHSALDKMRKSTAVDKYAEMIYKYTEWRPNKSVLLRTMNDVQVMWEPEKK
jgi:hypothetical protein